MCEAWVAEQKVRALYTHMARIWQYRSSNQSPGHHLRLCHCEWRSSLVRQMRDALAIILYAPDNAHRMRCNVHMPNNHVHRFCPILYRQSRHHHPRTTRTPCCCSDSAVASPSSLVDFLFRPALPWSHSYSDRTLFPFEGPSTLPTPAPIEVPFPSLRAIPSQHDEPAIDSRTRKIEARR